MALWKFCLTVFFIHPEEDRQVGRNIGVLQKRGLSSFVLYICYILFYEETINTYWMLVKDLYMCVYIYIYIQWNLDLTKSRVCYIENLDSTNLRGSDQNVRYIEVIVND